MGHIELASPVSHVWFFKGLPSRIGQLLDMSLRELEKILYFEEYVVLDPGKVPGIKKKDLLAVDKVRKLHEEHGHDAFKVGMGAEAIRELLRGHGPRRRWPASCAPRWAARRRSRSGRRSSSASRSSRRSSSPATSRSG